MRAATAATATSAVASRGTDRHQGPWLFSGAGPPGPSEPPDPPGPSGPTGPLGGSRRWWGRRPLLPARERTGGRPGGAFRRRRSPGGLRGHGLSFQGGVRSLPTIVCAVRVVPASRECHGCRMSRTARSPSSGGSAGAWPGALVAVVAAFAVMTAVAAAGLGCSRRGRSAGRRVPPCDRRGRRDGGRMVRSRCRATPVSWRGRTRPCRCCRSR